MIHPTATIFYSEIFTGGRKYYGSEGELFEYDLLSICTNGKRPDNTPLFREKMIITPHKWNVRRIGIMHDYDVFANIIVMTPPESADIIYNRINPKIGNDTALGITRLPNEAGLLIKILGKESSPVKEFARNICSITRQSIKNKPLPKEFPWR